MATHGKLWKPERIDEWLDEHMIPEPMSGCWLWTRTLKPQGYGHCDFQGRPYPAHKVVWQMLRGPIPAKMWIDHLCRNRQCVNPVHLEVVTPSINAKRGDAAKFLRERNKTAKRNAKGWCI